MLSLIFELHETEQVVFSVALGVALIFVIVGYIRHDEPQQVCPIDAGCNFSS